MSSTYSTSRRATDSERRVHHSSVTIEKPTTKATTAPVRPGTRSTRPSTVDPKNDAGVDPSRPSIAPMSARPSLTRPNGDAGRNGETVESRRTERRQITTRETVTVRTRSPAKEIPDQSRNGRREKGEVDRVKAGSRADAESPASSRKERDGANTPGEP